MSEPEQPQGAAAPAAGAPVPGWYQDDHGLLRWWDGTGWTEHVQIPGVAGQPTAAPPTPVASEPRVGGGSHWPWLIGMVVALLVLAVGALLIVSKANDDDAAPTDEIPSGDVTDAQTAAHSAQAAIETFSIDHDGSYAGATTADLAAIEPTLAGVPFTVAGQDDGYTITVTADDTTFAVVRSSEGIVTYSCTPPGGSGCDESGTWGQTG